MILNNILEMGNLWAALLVFLAVLVGFLKVVSQLPQATKLQLQTWPGIAQLIYQALIGMLSRKKSNKNTDITVCLMYAGLSAVFEGYHLGQWKMRFMHNTADSDNEMLLTCCL